MGLLGSIGSVVGGFTGMPWLGAVGSGVDAFMGERRGENAQEATNEFNAKQAQLNRDFQERMRATQYQTSVEDLKKAGLNPMLAYTQGGAGTPSGSVSAPALNKVSAGMSSAAQSAQTASSLQSIQMNQAQIDQIRAGTAKIASETLDQKVNTAAKIAQTVRDESSGSLSRQLANTEVTRQPGVAFDVIRKQLELEADQAQDTFSANAAKRKAESAKAQFGPEQAKTDLALSKLGIPLAQNEAKFQKEIGDAPQFVKFLYQLFNMGHSASSILRR